MKTGCALQIFPGVPTPIAKAMLGTRMGRLLIIDFVGFNRARRPIVRWECDCGTIGMSDAYHIHYGNSESCGCLRKERIVTAKTKHGHAKAGLRSGAYKCWVGIRKRCNNPNTAAFNDYGGRGIKVCSRWNGRDGFDNFLADMGEPAPGMSLERVDNDRGYSPDNCKWIPRSDQAKNRRYNWTLIFRGQHMNARDVEHILQITMGSLSVLLKNNGYKKGSPINLDSIFTSEFLDRLPR